MKTLTDSQVRRIGNMRRWRRDLAKGAAGIIETFGVATR